MLTLLLLIFFLSTSCNPGIKKQLPEKPNIIVIMADDLGYSDPGCFGGEIHTPNIDMLAGNGIRFTQMYNNARCCPTRATLMTGKYAHRVGLRFNGRSLNPDSPTIAELLSENGYHTGMAGKWHLSETRAVHPNEEQLKWMAHHVDHGPFSPVESYPSNRGFDEHWGVIWGVVNYFDPFSLVHNEKPIETVEDDFYMTNFITEKSIAMIDQFTADDDPFFLYVAHTAPHWPLHALPEDLVKYDGKYDAGWDELREQRYERMTGMGLVNRENYPLPPNSARKPWVECEQKEKESNHMEAHAAMVDRLDQGIGKIIDHLEKKGILDNTVIFFLADNGASYERGYPPGFDRPGFTRDSTLIDYDPYQPGSENTWGYLGASWASAANTPWRYWKKESFEGGIHTPFIMHWPDGLSGMENSLNKSVVHVMDLLPTILELTGATFPAEFNGQEVPPPDGVSMVPLLTGKSDRIHDTLYWEHEGGRAIRIGDLKMSALNNEDWELFDLSNDRTETNNIATQHPDKVSEMEMLWHEWAKSMGIK